jgi:hydroxymethylpyrimidine kinase/phosphomethylpyrimidine kinase
VKIGMLYSAELIGMVARKLAEYRVERIVVDPVMVAQSGDKLLQDDAVEALKDAVDSAGGGADAERAGGRGAAGARDSGAGEMPGAATDLMRLGCRNVLVKGGHLEGRDSEDVLVLAPKAGRWCCSGMRVETRNNAWDGLHAVVGDCGAPGEGR